MVSYGNGFNPLRWDCEKQGCFNKKNRPKIEIFAECLPGKIAFSDVDAITEINGNFLILEWKSFEGQIPTGQKIMYERLTQDKKFTVVVIHGNAETMEVKSILVFSGGKNLGWCSCTIDDLKNKIKRWA